MSNEQRRRRRRPSPADNHDAPDATRADVEALIERFNFPLERGAVFDWPGLAKVLAREARRYRLAMPYWLALFGGYREPPLTLQVLPGGAARCEDTTTHTRRSRSEAETRLRLVQGGRLR